MILAITKILYMKESQYGDPGRHLKHSLNYILASEKTGETLYTGSVNCQIPFAYEQMKSTKVQFGKTEKRQGYHIIISFEEGEIDAPTAYELVGKFVNTRRSMLCMIIQHIFMDISYSTALIF